MAKKLNVGAQQAKNVAREARKATNPKSQRAAVRAGTMTKAEAIEQATVRRAGVQAAGRRAAAGRAVERGVQERAARVVTRKAEQKAVGAMAQRAAGATTGGRVASAARTLAGNPVTAVQFAALSTVPDWNEFSRKQGFGATDVMRDWSDTSNARMARGKPQTAAQAAPRSPSAAAPSGGSVGPRTRGGARRAPVAAPAAQKPAAVKPAAQRKPKAAPKASSYGEASYAQHEAFRKELEAGGGRAAWNMGKQTAAGGERIEVTKSDTATTLGAELEKFQASGGKKPKRDIQIGGIAGRTGGKWHLGKKVGKG